MNGHSNLLTSDKLGRYYTNRFVGDLLVNSINSNPPTLVLDLGAGDGALTAAAAAKWQEAKYFTVDIDKNARSAELPILCGSHYKHHVGDALSEDLGKKIGLEFGSTDIAVCNPPYIRPRWRKGFSEIMEESGLSHVLPKISDVPAEILFIAQNLRFLKTHGSLGLVVPDGIVAGEKFAALRKALALEHTIEKIIELPRHIFNRTEAKAHILILSKNTKGRDEIEVQRLEPTGELSSIIKISPEQFGRLDYTFLNSQRYLDGAQTYPLGRVIVSLSRGNTSSSQIPLLAYPVLHTTDIDSSSKNVPPGFELADKHSGNVKGRVARAGDILLARVGRNLDEKVCMVNKGNVVVSDCIFMLRVKPAYRKAVFAFLRSALGRQVLQHASHGVGARFLTSNAIKQIRIQQNDTI